MKDKNLLFTRAYEQAVAQDAASEIKPVFHLAPYIGWLNDPNGFSFYQGQYHLFYQYNPYSTEWDSMHWGHAVSRDLLRWTHLPAALAPDEFYDAFGCFSGSAIELPDGKHLLLYTGVREEGGGKTVQTQCVAVGDGLDYPKYAGNPVIDEAALPAGLSRNDFRDPKVWREADNSLRCVISTCNMDGLGRVLLFSSPDGLSWRFESVLMENDGRLGRMWECPDFFSLNGKHVLLVSPMDMLPEGFEYHNGNGTVCMIGRYDEGAKRFIPEADQAIDYGIDFYAPQTILTPDGRRVMIGWMQNPDTCTLNRISERKWFGQMSLPREVSVRNGRLYQRPVRELEQYRSNPVFYKSITVLGNLRLSGIEGRTVDMEMTIRPDYNSGLYQKFTVCFAQDKQYKTSLSFRPHESTLKIDRKFSGSRRACIHQRRCLVHHEKGMLRLRIILDRFSAEIFVNDGEQVMSAAISTDIAAKGISFFSDGQVLMDITKYDLFA